LAELFMRVAEAFVFVVTRRRAVNGTPVVLTHGLVCRALVQRHALVHEGISVPQHFDNTSITALHEDAPHAVSMINCTRHLSASLEIGFSGALA
jgi:broad specificity phosphatase PhoE